jgi:hypothetical protein
MVERAQSLHPRLRIPAGGARNGDELLALGRRVARAQGRGGTA